MGRKKKEKEELPKKPEEKKEEKPKGENICNRCGYKYEESEIVTRQQQKCCPECFAPIIWKA